VVLLEGANVLRRANSGEDGPYARENPDNNECQDVAEDLAGSRVRSGNGDWEGQEKGRYDGEVINRVGDGALHNRDLRSPGGRVRSVASRRDLGGGSLGFRKRVTDTGRDERQPRACAGLGD